MNVTIEIRGRTFNEVGEALIQALPEATERAGQALVDSLQDWLSRKGSGAIVRSRKGGGVHQASAPGEPPAPDTYELHDSVRIGTQREGVVTVVVSAPGKWLDEGTATMAPRPFVAGAMADAEDDIVKAIDGAIVQALADRDILP